MSRAALSGLWQALSTRCFACRPGERLLQAGLAIFVKRGPSRADVRETELVKLVLRFCGSGRRLASGVYVERLYL